MLETVGCVAEAEAEAEAVAGVFDATVDDQLLQLASCS